MEPQYSGPKQSHNVPFQHSNLLKEKEIETPEKQRAFRFQFTATELHHDKALEFFDIFICFCNVIKRNTNIIIFILL